MERSCRGVVVLFVILAVNAGAGVGVGAQTLIGPPASRAPSISIPAEKAPSSSPAVATPGARPAASPAPPIIERTNIEHALSRANELLRTDDDSDGGPDLHEVLVGEFCAKVRIRSVEPRDDGSIRLRGDMAIRRSVNVSREKGEAIVAANREALSQAKEERARRLRELSYWKRHSKRAAGRLVYVYIHCIRPFENAWMSEHEYKAMVRTTHRESNEAIDAASKALALAVEETSRQRDQAVKVARTVELDVVVPMDHELASTLHRRREANLVINFKNFTLAPDGELITHPAWHVGSLSGTAVAAR